MEQSEMASESERVQIGYVSRAHGIRGALRLRSTFSEWQVTALFIDGRAYPLRRVQADAHGAIVELEGVATREAAEALRGSSVEVLRSDLPPLEENELYVADLVGCEAVAPDGERLGQVREVFFGGGHEVLVIDGERSFMVPFVASIVTAVDLEARRLVCDLPEGLAELNDGTSSDSSNVRKRK